jgi:hypothetical protein
VASKPVEEPLPEKPAADSDADKELDK